MLDLDLDLEADLGVDTVKQAEVFAAVRETLRHRARREPQAARLPHPDPRHRLGPRQTGIRRHLRRRAAAPAAAPPRAGRRPPAAARRAHRRVLAIVAEKTGYPADMLDLDLDLEADLGVDTVKQAEVFAAVREPIDIARDDNLKLRDFPTLTHVIGFVRDRTGILPPPPATTPPATCPPAAPAAAAAPRGDDVTDAVVAIVAEKTGYPADLLDLDLDLEADLGVDTVKQAEVFAAVRERYGVERDDNLKLRDFPTLRHVVGWSATAPAASRPPRHHTARHRPRRCHSTRRRGRRSGDEITAAAW